MCGELEEEENPEDVLYARFTAHVQSFLATLKVQRSDDPIHAYLDKLFRDQLKNAADETRAPATIGGFERLAMEPLVFARLAGFMAAHLPLNEDPLRRLIEALMTGYSEGEIELHDHDHDHDHDHGHGHSHGHGHGHAH